MPQAETPLAKDLFSDEQLETFLGLIRDGIPRNVAARRIGATGRLMRSLSRPERDPDFARRYEEAEAEGREFYPDRLATEARSLALAGDQRMLEVELATHAPQYRHLRRDRMNVSGTINHEHAVTLVLDPAVLDGWPREKLLAFRDALAELAGQYDVDAEPRELPRAS